MKKLFILIAFLFVGMSYAQITVINTGTTEHLYKISRYQNNYLISGYQHYLGKCYNDCNTLFPLTVPTTSNPGYTFDVARIDTSTLYLTSISYANLNFTIWKSEDGGYNWQKRFDTTSTSMYYGITGFFDKHSGISFSSNQTSLITVNGLNTYSFGAWPDVTAICTEVNGDSTIIVGSHGVYGSMFISKNRGNTWQGVGPTSGFGQLTPMDIEFLNKDTIFGITDVVQWYSSFFRSFNSGATWSEFSFTRPNMTVPAESFNKLCVKSNKEIYILARDGPGSGGYSGNAVILKSSDLGQNWQSIIMPFQTALLDMAFINDSTALVCGLNGLLFKWNTKTAVFTGIKNNNMDELPLTAFPNPVIDMLHLQFKDNTSIKLTTVDILGQTVNEVLFTGKEADVSFSDLPSGIYFVHVESDKQHKTIKVIKE